MTWEDYEYVRLFGPMAAGPIDDHMSNLIIAQLMYLESENPETPVSLLIQQTPVKASGLNLSYERPEAEVCSTFADQHVH